MGQKLMDIYAAINREGDPTGQMRLAMKTGVPSVKAKDMPDSPEYLSKFTWAYKEITGKDCPIK